MRHARALACAFGVIGTLLTFPAGAQPRGDTTAAAEDLFQRGKSLMTSGKYDDACPLFAESYRLDPAGGTLQNLAVCYESNGKWASAYARFQELRSISKNATPPRADRIKLAEEHLERLKTKVAHVVVVLDSATRGELQIDGVVYQRASWSAGVAVDPGEHVVTLTATGKEPFKTTVTTGNDGDEQRVRVPALKDLAPVLAVQSDRRTPDELDARERARQADADRKLRLVGFVAGGAGVAFLGAGLVFGALAIGKNNDGSAKCNAGPGADPEQYTDEGHCLVGSMALGQANEAKDSARLLANVANVLVPLGVVGVGVGVYLIVRSNRQVRLSASARGLSLDGTF